MNVSGTRPTFQDASSAVTLKQNIDKTQLVNTLGEVKNSGQITREQFKTISKGIEGGEKAFSDVLKTIMPENDINKLKDFSLAKLFTGNSDIKVSLDSGKLGTINEGFQKIINKTKDTGEQFSNALGAVKNSIDKLKNNGDEVAKIGFVKTGITGSVGASNTVDNSLVSNIIGLTNSEMGVSAGANISGSVSITAKNVDGKIKLALEGRFSTGAELNAQAKIGGSGEGANAGMESTYIKKVIYTFDNAADAKKFIENKGVGFQPGEGFQKKEKGGWETKSSNILDSGYKLVDKTSQGGLLSSVVGNKSMSRQILSADTISTDKKEVKNYNLDTSSGIITTNKNTSTQLSITRKKDPETGAEKFSGNFSLEIDLNKIKNNSDKASLVNKLVGRMDILISGASGDAKIDKAGLKSYVEGTIDRLIRKKDNYFSENYTSKSGDEKTGKLFEKSGAREFNASVGIDTGIGGVSLGVGAKMGHMIKLSIPLEMDTVQHDGEKPKLVVAHESEHMVQLTSLKGGSLGAGIGIGASGVASAEAGISGGFEKSSAFKLTRTEKSA